MHFPSYEKYKPFNKAQNAEEALTLLRVILSVALKNYMLSPSHPSERIAPITFIMLAKSP